MHGVYAQAPLRLRQRSTAAPPPTAELAAAAAKAPATADLAKGDPGGTITGTINDVPVGDSTKRLSRSPMLPTKSARTRSPPTSSGRWSRASSSCSCRPDSRWSNQGLCRVKNANHTYMMNFMVYACGLFSYWLIGFAIQMGGAAGNGNLGGLKSLTGEHTISLFGKTWGLFGASRVLPVRPHL